MMPQFAEENRDHNKELIELVGGLAQRHDCTPAQVSLAWMICKRPFIVPIPGTRKASRLAENLGAADVILSPEEIAAIDAQLDAMDIGPVFGGTALKK
jgi:aryl-alcohol dehydrogenase-like predicted oxidoreductase